MSRDWLLFLHLLGVLLFVGGSVGVTALRLAAIAKERPSESAVLLRATRPLIPVVLVGLLLTLGAGFSLADELGVPLDSGWLQWTYALVAWLVLVGAVAGRLDRKTRELAEGISLGSGVHSGLRPQAPGFRVHQQAKPHALSLY